MAFGDNLRGPYIDLLEWGTPDPGRPLTWKSIGIPRIAVGVDDVGGFYERLSEAGADILGPPGSLKVGRSSIRAFRGEGPRRHPDRVRHPTVTALTPVQVLDAAG